MSVFVFFLSGIGHANAKFSKAKYHGKALCTTGAFLDPRNGGECWSCPKKTNWTVFSVTSTKACETPKDSWAKAKYRGKVKNTKPKGSFRDARKGGEYWSCPKKYPRRTAYGVTNKRACATKRIIGEKLSKAKYRGKVKNKKPSGAFRDPRKGGQYWSCPKGYGRSVFAVTAGNACHKVNKKTSFLKASYQKKFGCGKGKFFDPRKGGQCWSCPSGQFRTVDPVTHTKACTTKPLDIFALDTGVVCKGVINALNSGAKEVEKFTKTLKSITDPITKPINAVMDKMTGQVKSPKELNKMVKKLAKPMKPFEPIFAEVNRIQKDAKNKKNKLKKIMLNSKLMCGGNTQKIISALKSAGLKPNIKYKKASLMDGIFISSAHAATTKTFVSFSVGLGALLPVSGGAAGNSTGYTFVTDFDSYGGHFFASGPSFSTTPGVGLGLGIMIFPAQTIQDMDGGGVGGSISFSKGKAVQTLIESLPKKYQKIIPAGFAIGFDPTFQSPPNGIGLDWDLVDSGLGLGENGQKIINVGLTIDGSFKLGN